MEEIKVKWPKRLALVVRDWQHKEGPEAYEMQFLSTIPVLHTMNLSDGVEEYEPIRKELLCEKFEAFFLAGAWARRIDDHKLPMPDGVLTVKADGDTVLRERLTDIACGTGAPDISKISFPTVKGQYTAHELDAQRRALLTNRLGFMLTNTTKLEVHVSHVKVGNKDMVPLEVGVLMAIYTTKGNPDKEWDPTMKVTA